MKVNKHIIHEYLPYNKGYDTGDISVKINKIWSPDWIKESVLIGGEGMGERRDDTLKLCLGNY